MKVQVNMTFLIDRNMNDFRKINNAAMTIELTDFGCTCYRRFSQFFL